MQELIKKITSVLEFGEKNVSQLYGTCQQQETTQDYYLGLLRRQCILLSDLKVLLENRTHDNFTTLFVICRCIVDDFLHVYYLTTNDNEIENVVRINASAFDKSFKGLDMLAQSNETHFESKYEHYPTKERMSELKAIFAGKEENSKFFRDLGAFEFKKFLQVTQLAEKIPDFELSKLAARAFYLWKEFSDFIHYSNLTLELELDGRNIESYNAYLDEVITYAYNTIEMSFRYFKNHLGLELMIDLELERRLMINYPTKEENSRP